MNPAPTFCIGFVFPWTLLCDLGAASAMKSAVTFSCIFVNFKSSEVVENIWHWTFVMLLLGTSSLGPLLIFLFVFASVSLQRPVDQIWKCRLCNWVQISYLTENLASFESDTPVVQCQEFVPWNLRFHSRIKTGCSKQGALLVTLCQNQWFLLYLLLPGCLIR